ncbi:MAG: nicotinamide riboside transporter PnuC [Bacteroidetes bacterium]|nr:nicotinamide riboside transporter PnuC [Bacteroidota bacterium]
MLEAIAALSGLLSVYLLTRQNIWCWPTGLLSVATAAVVFYDSFLYSDMLLHVYYIGMNVYGWIHWARGGNDPAQALPVTTMSRTANVVWAIVTMLLVFAWGWGMSHLDVIAAWVLEHINDSIDWAQAWASGDAPVPAYPYGDAFTTVASLIAMWFMARKRLENWVYWFVIDVAAITIYILKGLFLFAGQYAIFLVLCVMGYREWVRSMNALQSPGAN